MNSWVDDYRANVPWWIVSNIEYLRINEEDLLFRSRRREVVSTDSLAKAVRGNDLEQMRRMLRETSVSHLNQDIYGYYESGKTTLLHEAIRCGSTEIVCLLLDYGVSMNRKDSKGRTPLLLAMENMSVDFVRMLLAHNASPSVWNEYNETPFHLAARYSPDILQLLMDADPSLADRPQLSGHTPLIYAASYGTLRSLAILLSWKQRSKSRLDCAGLQRLMIATIEGVASEVGQKLELLATEMRKLQQRRKLTFSNITELPSPLLSLCGETRHIPGRSLMVHKLLKWGCHKNDVNNWGQTPLAAALYLRDSATVRVLVASGCRLPDPSVALPTSATDMELLLAAGANPAAYRDVLVARTRADNVFPGSMTESLLAAVEARLTGPPPRLIHICREVWIRSLATGVEDARCGIPKSLGDYLQMLDIVEDRNFM